MRVWSRADPRSLCRKHLLGEHLEVHMLMSAIEGRGWTRHPEARRWSGWPEGRDFLLCRHELLRAEMSVRWPDRHGFGRHRSPLPFPTAARWYIIARGYWISVDWDTLLALMDDVPASPFGADTPWERDGMTLEEYTNIGDRWNAAEHKNGGVNAAR